MHLPGPLRAAVGLVATAASEAKHLPDRAIELPMLAVSSALQASLRAQQRYARLAARGDEVLNRRTPTDDPPAWATFDEPVTDEPRRSVFGAGATGAAGSARSMLDELLGVDDPTATPGEPVDEIPTFDEAPPAARKAPAKKAVAKKAVARKTAAKKTSAAKAPAAKKTPTKAARTGAKNVSKPRHSAPSAFDNVADDPDDRDVPDTSDTSDTSDAD